MSFSGIVYSKDYYVDIGQHVFPTIKYKLIYQKLISDDGLSPSSFIEPKPASDDDILLVHDKEYLHKLKTGSLSPSEIFTLELPYSERLVNASYLCVGGTILAMDIALKEGMGIHLGGGFHHAFPDHGEGFCVLNDIAVGIRKMQKDAKIKKALVIDCDLHQGNGTAFTFSNDDSVFTFSIHQENNYPYHKPRSNLDIGLRDFTRDEEYLNQLKSHIPKIMNDFKPEIVVYVAGADPYKDDMIGNLALTIDGLKARDEFIFETAHNFSVPITCVLAGGYAKDYNDTVDIHYNTIMTGLRKKIPLGG